MYLAIYENLSVIIWFIIFLIFFFLEIINKKDIFFIYFSVASLLSAILGIFVKNIEVQIVVFIISSLLLIVFVKIILDKAIEFNFRFYKKDYNEDRICFLLKEEDEDYSLYKVISKSGIYTAKYINSGRQVRKFKFYNIIHDDGHMIIIR